MTEKLSPRSLQHRRVKIRQRMRQMRYLKSLARTGSRSIARREAGIAKGTLSTWRHSAEFEDAERVAVRDGLDDLQDEALRRAYAGSDMLLRFMLEGLHPDHRKDGQLSSGSPEDVAAALREWYDDLEDFVPLAPPHEPDLLELSAEAGD